MAKSRIWLIIILCNFVVACAKKEVTHGFLFTQSKVADIKIGESGKEELTELLGTPTTVSKFGEETWYYVASKREYSIIGKSKLIDQKILAVKFDQDGKVKTIDSYNENNANNLAFAKDHTPVKGDDTRIIKHIVENTGKFNTMRK
jgi:outer membrane protein assembly factor BamE (lipoprotein component of BamABCDE complex)